jgi:DNA-binding NtrC family response regulator
MLKKVLVVDEDLDVHELLHDILEINFKQVKIERALSYASFLKKIEDAKTPYDLILLNTRLKNENGKDVVASLRTKYPAILDRIILIADSPVEQTPPLATEIPSISRPFSLDHFGEIIKKVCNV